MKKNKFTIGKIIGTSILILLLGIGIAWYNSTTIRNFVGRKIATSAISNPAPPPKRQHAILDSAYLKQFHNGDIMLRRGFGLITESLLDGMEGKYPVTHCGVLYKGEQDTMWQIIQAESNDVAEGVYKEDVRIFIVNSFPKSLAVVRLKAPKPQQEVFMNSILYYLDKKAPFDYDFNDQDTSQLYCTEMIDLSLQKATSKHLLPIRTSEAHFEGPSFDNFFDTTNFHILFNQTKVK